MHEIKSFRIFQTAKVIGVMYAIMFAIFGVIEFLIFMRMAQRPPHFAIVMVVMPIIGAIFSFVGVAIACWVYNLIAPSIGGIAFELDSAQRELNSEIATPVRWGVSDTRPTLVFERRVEDLSLPRLRDAASRRTIAPQAVLHPTLPLGRGDVGERR